MRCSEDITASTVPIASPGDPRHHGSRSRVPPSRRPRRREGRDGGYVTAETALVVPTLVLLMGVLLWATGAAVTALQCSDAARAAARAAARGESEETVRGTALALAPQGAEVTRTRDDALHRVRVTARTPTAGPLPAVRVATEAVAHVEP
ncbi:TadE family type IV pilus minor pilin [Streptomyces sp. ST2-7A]|uniref:TadE family type IV pilus minor pilin n=1 Tax=Streptomyces sp. ST2-7A TaxID=2907214 RepID=UPI001F1A2EC7|nr:TadE family type IV pilus minor pilin [Streptomyces sp. ST2-7A]MCE7080085.1 pilus assembly protein [Streptomyces sp. ST2-7A]